MRIDLTSSGLGQPESSKPARPRQTETAANDARGSAGASASASVDRTRFSFDQTRVQSLESQALAAPEIRQAKVASLGQDISSGNYSVDPAKVADAITSELAGASFG